MALHRYHDMSYSDEEKYDREKKLRGPVLGSGDDDYPYGLSFYVTLDDLDRAGAGHVEPGMEMQFCADACVTSVYKDEDDCRIELEIEEFCGEDGDLFKLAQRGHISLCSRDCMMMDLDCDCDVGDYLCMEGMVCVKSVSKSEFGDNACLQITQLTHLEPEE